MRDINRIDDVLNTLSAIWKAHPDLRLGQLIANAINESQMYYIEDNRLIENISNFYGVKDNEKV